MASNEGPQTRVRVSVSTGELEVEGSQDFVQTFQSALDDLVGLIKRMPPSATTAAKPSGEASNGSAAKNVESFPEALQAMPNTASGSDQILLAGYYVAQSKADGLFSTGEANSLLQEQGIKLSNPSQSLRNALTAKRVFKQGKSFKLSRAGEEHLKNLGVI